MADAVTIDSDRPLIPPTQRDRSPPIREGRDPPSPLMRETVIIDSIRPIPEPEDDSG
jgi:hypothetical protein